MFVSLDGEEVWSETLDLIVLDALPSPPAASASVTIESVERAPAGPVAAGGAAVFHVEASVEFGWANLDVRVIGDVGSGIRAEGAHVLDSGHLGFVPPESAVLHRDGDVVAVDFGLVENVDPGESDTRVVLAVVFSVHPSVGSVSVTGLAVTVGGVAVPPAELEFDVVANVR